MRNAILCVAVLLTGVGNAYPQSPYAGQEARTIKALAPQDIADLLAGKGMGLAKAAELNGYPGPAHVMELAHQLQLTTQQKASTETLFEKTRARAALIGRQLVEEERALDGQFAAKSITQASLQQSLQRIAELQAKLRQLHLEAHLEQAAILSHAQVATYARLRGYRTGGDQTDRHPH